MNVGPQVLGVEGGHTVDCRHMTTGTRVCKVGSPRDYGRVTKSEGFGEAALPRDSDM